MAVVVKWLTQRIVAPSLARSNRVSRPSSGDDSDVEIPVPIPNTEVKHINADDSRKAKIGSCQFNAPLGEFFLFSPLFSLAVIKPSRPAPCRFRIQKKCRLLSQSAKRHPTAPSTVAVAGSQAQSLPDTFVKRPHSFSQLQGPSMYGSREGNTPHDRSRPSAGLPAPMALFPS